MKNSSKFFENRDCEYYPCHKGMEDINCMFCYCPFYIKSNCPGNPNYINIKDGKIIKDCSECTFPHKPKNYDLIMKMLVEE